MQLHDLLTLCDLRQADQSIPPWLEDDASSELYSSHSQFGRFGGKDIRKASGLHLCHVTLQAFSAFLVIS
jgi:hypothetical protein